MFSTYPAEPRVRQCVCGRRQVQGQPGQNTNEEMHVAVRLQEDGKLRQSRDNYQSRNLQPQRQDSPRRFPPGSKHTQNMPPFFNHAHQG